MCNFCNNILNEKDYKMLSIKERETCIVKINSNKYGLSVECDDWYYSGIKIQISYCPMCGRKLNDREV